MKNKILSLLLLVVSYGFSQSVNDYKAVIIPVQYEFQASSNQYRLQTLTKPNLEKAGFKAYYANESVPEEFNNRCDLLYLNVEKASSFLSTKLYVLFNDCNNKLIYKSEVGVSREKEFEVAYKEALNEAFKSVIALKYKYNGGLNTPKNMTVLAPVAPSASVTVVPASSVEDKNSTAPLLYAQLTTYGYQLIDSEPKVVMKVYKTSNSNSYMATKGTLQGALVAKDNQWFFEYYQDDKLVSEKVSVKF